jgi:hypothetical protein
MRAAGIVMVHPVLKLALQMRFTQRYFSNIMHIYYARREVK